MNIFCRNAKFHRCCNYAKRILHIKEAWHGKYKFLIKCFTFYRKMNIFSLFMNIISIIICFRILCAECHNLSGCFWCFQNLINIICVQIHNCNLGLLKHLHLRLEIIFKIWMLNRTNMIFRNIQKYRYIKLHLIYAAILQCLWRDLHLRIFNVTVQRIAQMHL